MIKINKILTEVPASLTSPKTRTKLKEIITTGSYDDKYNKSYKEKDTKNALDTIYHGKCAYCEWMVEQLHVEHYRPKKGGYHWLAFSWDNLLFACPTCNQKKNDNFEIMGKKISTPPCLPNKGATQNEIDSFYTRIHELSHDYDATELPKIVNPEKDDPRPHITFSRNGSISSTEARFAFTIERLDLNRKKLMNARRKILEDFRKQLSAVWLEKEGTWETSIRVLINCFIEQSDDLSNPYSAFRKFAVSQFIKEITKESKEPKEKEESSNLTP